MSMTLPKFIGITELRNSVRSVFDRLAKDRGPIVVIRGSKPEAVIVPYQDYENLVSPHPEKLAPEAPRVPAAQKP